MGFIPNEQNNFVEKIRDEIRKQKLERVQGAGLNINNPTMVGGIPNQPSSSGLQQQQQGMQQIIVSQQQSMPGGLPVSSMGVGPSTMTMAGGTLTMASGKYSLGKIMAIINHIKETLYNSTTSSMLLFCRSLQPTDGHDQHT